MRLLRAVLFDAGDTLIRLRAGSGALVLRAAARLGIDLDQERAAAIWRRVTSVASSPEELAKGRDLSPERHREVWTDLYRMAGADTLAPGLSDTLYQLTTDATSWEAFVDAEPVLRDLHSLRVPVGVVSDTGFDLRPAFDALKLTPWIGTVLLSCEHGTCKPDPRVFTTACAALGVEPAETLMVGDNPMSDGGACAGGLTVLLLPPPAPTGPRGLAQVLALVTRSQDR